MKLASLLLTGALAALPLVASAQWQWLDAGGRKVFSDKSPPPDIPEKSILKRPGNMTPRQSPPVAIAVPGSAAGAAASATASGAANGSVSATAGAGAGAEASATPATAASGARPVLGQDKELLERTKQAEAAEAAKKKTEADQVAKARADNCARARQAKASFDSGIRIAQVNSKGEREILDDAGRAAELRRTQQVIDSDCK